MAANASAPTHTPAATTGDAVTGIAMQWQASLHVLHDGDHVFGDRRGRMRRPDQAGKAALWIEKGNVRSEEHTSELQSIMRNSSAVFCSKKKNPTPDQTEQPPFLFTYSII